MPNACNCALLGIDCDGLAGPMERIDRFMTGGDVVFSSVFGLNAVLYLL